MGKRPRLWQGVPLSRAPIKLGSAWRWRLDHLQFADGRAGRLLTHFRDDREEFRAWLATEPSTGLVIVARLEDHGTHPGLHVHADCGPRDNPEGRVVWSGIGRWPEAERRHRRRGEFTELAAQALAMEFFAVHAPPGALL